MFPCTVWVCVRAFLIHDATDAPRDIRLCWRGRERTLACVRMHVHAQGMDRRSRASLPLRPLRSFLLITPLVSRFLPPLASFTLSLSPPSTSFLSLFLSLSFYDPRSALPPTRLVRTIGVSTLETLHAWHTCKRARKSTQYRYRCADTEKSARKPVSARYDLSLRAPRETPRRLRGKYIPPLCLLIALRRWPP